MMKRIVSIITAFLLLAAFFPVVAEDEYPNYLLDVKVGEWVQYKMPGGMEQKQTVVAVDEKEVTIKTEIFMDGNSVMTNESKMPLKAEVDESEIPREVEGKEVEKPKITHGSVSVNGKDIDCMIVEYETSKLYISNDIPLTGMIKMESEGNVMMEIVEYGTDGE